MGRVLGGLLSTLVVLLGLGGIYVYDLFSSLEVESVGDDVWVIRGVGGNVGVLRTEKGPVVVDSMSLRMQGERIRERAEQLAGGSVQALLNTHYHIDHSHGNPGFAPGTRIIATQRTLDNMLHFDAGYWEGSARETLPNELFSADHEMKIGGKTIRSRYLGRGHTDGDLVVIFVEDRVLHTGDLLFHGRYPRVDLAAGGSIEAWIGTLDRVLELDFDRVIPGHGPTTDREGILAFQGFLKELWAVGQQAASEGLSLERTLEVAELSTDEGFGVGGVPLVFPIDRDSVVTEAWQEATGAVKPEEVPSVEQRRSP